MGEGAGGKEVGRISIRAVPNTDKFRGELEEQLKKIEDDLRVKVKVVPDFDDFREKVRAEETNLPDAKVKVKADTSDLFQKRLLSDLAGAHKQLEAKIPLTVDGEEFRRNIAEQVKGTSKDLKVKIDEDLGIAAGQREELLAQVEAVKTLAERQPIKIKLQTDDKFDFRLRQRLSKIKPPEPPEPGKSWLDAGISSAGSVASAASGALGPLRILTDQTVLLAIAIVSLAAPALALLSGALVALPALVGGIAAPIGVVILGMDGIKKAAENAGLLGTSKGKGGKEKTTLGEALKSIKTQVSDVFEKGLTPVFKQLGALLPIISAGATNIAHGLVDAATAITDVITSGPALDQLAGFVNNVADAVHNSIPGIKDFTAGMLGLVSGVGKELPGWADMFSSWGDTFKSWVNDISKVGPDGTSELTNSMENLKGALSGVVDLIGQLGDDGLKLLADPKMGNDIKQFLTDFSAVVHDSVPILAGAFEHIADIIHEVRKDWHAMFGGDDPDKLTLPRGFQPWWDPSKQPPLPPQSPFKKNPYQTEPDTLAQFGREVGPPPPNLALPAITSAATVVAGWTTSVASSLWSSIKDMFTFGAPGKGQGNILDLIMPVANAATQGEQAGQAAGLGFQKAIAAARGEVNAGPKAPGQGPVTDLPIPLDTGGAPPAAAAAPDPKAVVGPIQDAIASVQPALAGMKADLASLAPTLTASLSGIGPAVAAAFAGIPAAAALATQGLATSFQTAGAAVMAEVQSWPGKIQSALAGLAGIGEAAGAALGQGMANGIAAGKGAAVAAAKDLADAVTQASKVQLGVNSPSTVFHDIGLGITEGMSNGIESGTSDVLDSTKRLHNAVKAAGNVNPDPNLRITPSDDPNFNKPRVPGWWDDLLRKGSGHYGWWQAPYNQEAPPPPDEQGPTRPPTGDSPYNPFGFHAIGLNVAEGLGNGINGGQPAAVAAAKGLADAVTTAAKDTLGIKSPSTVFHGIGTNTSQGLGDGLEGGFPGVISRAKTLADQLSQAMKDGLVPSGLKNDLKSELTELGTEYDTLKVQRDALAPGDKAGRAGISDQMKQISTLRDQLGLAKDQIGTSGKGGQSDSTNEAAQMLTQGLASMIDAGKNFVSSNVSQFENDLGISGKGAIPTIAKIGLNWGEGLLKNGINGAFGGGQQGQGGGDTHIHVQSVDEAMQVKQTQENKAALQFTQR